MRRITRLLCWIESINKPTAANRSQRIAFLLLLPFIVCCDLLFECFVLLQERQLILLDRQLPGVNLGHCTREFRKSFTTFGFVASVNRCLKYVGCVSESGDE